MNNEIQPGDDARDDDNRDVGRAGETHEIPADTYASEEDVPGDGCGGGGGGTIAAEMAMSSNDGGAGGGGGVARRSAMVGAVDDDVGDAARTEIHESGGGGRAADGTGDVDGDDDDGDDDENNGDEDDHATGKRKEQHIRHYYPPPVCTNNNNNNGGPSTQQIMFFEPTMATTNHNQYPNNHGINNGGPSLMYDPPSPGYYAPYHDGDHPSNYVNQQHHLPYASSLHHPHPTPYGNIGYGFLPPNLPPPQQLLPPPPPALSSSANLDATRQYYEARMRDHAMQYANAAAGAAWAAARIACGVGFDDNIIGGGGLLSHSASPTQNFATDRHRQPYYTPAPPMTTTTVNSNPMMMAPWCHGGDFGGGPRQKRTLWHHENKAQKATTSAALASPPPPPPSSQQEKMRSKKRESGGNDSISSLGSESREHLSIGHRDIGGVGGGDGEVGRGKYSWKKSNQRRRFNEEDEACARGDVEANKADDDRVGGGGVRNNDEGNNQRQKRGLHHGHSSKSSFSSLGSSNNNTINDVNNLNRHSAAGRNKKKKNLSHPETPKWPPQQKESNALSLSSAPPSSVLLGRLIGKNGVRALHELCSKYRWDMPKYTPVEPPQQILSKSADNDDGKNSNSVGNNEISFVLTVHVDGVELGRGRGGTKASAKQDASRKALSALVPGVVFDPNGILLDMGGSKSLLRGGSHVDVGGGEAPGENDGQSRSDCAGSEPLSLDELGPHLASQLAIGGDGVVHGRSSPDHSETSSISTIVSEEVVSGDPLVSGGPLLLSHKLGSHSATLASLNAAGKMGRFLSSSIYPCTSTTSGVSSASEVDDEDENAYYSSRGASVCSTLLHALWQIDDRIWEPPSYSFDLCPSTGNATENLKSGDSLAALGTASKREKVELPREVSGNRMFKCTATINLYFPKRLVGDCLSSIMDYWESPLDYLQSTECSSPSSCDKGESLQSRKRKDSFASQTPNKDVVEAQEETPKTPEKHEKGNFLQHKIENTATGLTKRESKHKASAKLLATLFPACNSMVEVKAEAEAARELYAAKKESSQAKRPKIMVLSAEKKSSSKRSAFPNAGPTKNDISLQALSLSEPKDGTKRIKWNDSLDVEYSFAGEVDAALHIIQESDEEGRWITRDLSFDDVGKIVLRRACCDDTDHIHLLLNKSEIASAALPPKQLFSTPNEAALTDNDVPPESGNEDQDYNHVKEEYSTDGKNEEQQLGDHSIILVLARAVALRDPPLGCAILTVKDSTCEGRSLTLDRLCYEEHLPRERFIESIETFVKYVHCTLDTRSDGLAVTLNDIKSFLSRSPPPLYRPEDVVDCAKGGSSHRHLQSVKEEESEEVDDGSDGGEVIDGKIVDGGTELVKRKPCKPSKRSRVA